MVRPLSARLEAGEAHDVVTDVHDLDVVNGRVSSELQKRPRQDSNLRHRLRRAIRFVQLIFSVHPSAPGLGPLSS